MKLEIIKNRKKFYLISAIILLLGIGSLFVRQLNLGIDFTSGTILEIDLQQDVATGDVRTLVNEVELKQEPVIRKIDGTNIVQIKTETLEDVKRQELLDSIRQAYPESTLEKADLVDPIFGKELARQALFALLIANFLMVIYITWRFEFKFAVAAILALLHDVVVVLTVFSLAQIEINSSFVAAILLIVGYSINDTIVIFDRIRENLKNRKRGEEIEVIANNSLQQTMRRSINTSLTTLLAVGALLILGGSTLRPFSLALFIGIISGTYSSIFFASPIWVDMRKRSA
jgi:preprotein translocase subunit SecF